MGNTRWSTRPRPLEERFWEKVDKSGECWVWVGGVTSPGQHGRTFADGRRVIASRVSWEMHFGPIPPGMEVCHHCDNPPCVRPDHLFLGTHRDNMRDASRKGRTAPQVRDWSLCKRGHVLAETGYRAPGTGRRRCRTCAHEGRQERTANLTSAQREEINRRRRAMPRPEPTEASRARKAEAMRRYRARRKTPVAMAAAADKLGEAMG